MKIILGSQSQSRQLLLRQAGIVFDVLPANIDERAIRSDDYVRLPLILARAKAEALLPSIEEPSLLITSDQVTVFEEELREKPLNEVEARHFLESYGSGLPILAHNAVVVINTGTGKRKELIDSVSVRMKPLPEAIIDQLIASQDVYRWAGGVGVEHPLVAPYIIERQGELDTIMGLSLGFTLASLQALQG